MAEAAVSDKFAQVRGFKVEIDYAGGKEVDTAWESVSSGQAFEATTDKFQTNSPGHKTVGEITLRGAMTDERNALCTWINETVMGKPWRRTVAITALLLDGTIGETWIFNNCAIRSYTMPPLTAGNPQDSCPSDLTEELRFTYSEVIIRP